MDWKNFIPTDNDHQESENTWAETNGCVSFAMVHDCEIQEKYLTGTETDYSEQVLCVESGTNPTYGNDLGTVFATLERIGLVRTAVSPEPVNFTVQQFYTPLQPNLVATGQDWLKRWTPSLTTILGYTGKPVADYTPIFNALPQAPVLITIDLNPNGETTGRHQFHEVVLLNETEYFDSYGTLVKPLNFKIYAANQLIIKPKNMAQILTQAKGAERRIVLAAADETEWQSLCNVFGKPTDPVDENVN